MTPSAPRRIGPFVGPYRFLSNFYLRDILLEGEVFPSAEHLFQALKTDDPEWRALIRLVPTCGEAKRLGRLVPLREGWREGKDVQAMTAVQRAKYQYPDLRQWLLNTGDAELVEINTWGDTYWGVCEGAGLNKLGKVLMAVREEIRQGNGANR